MISYKLKNIFLTRFGKGGVNLTMEEYEEEFTQVANLTKYDANVSVGWIGNYKINNGTVDGEFDNKSLLYSRNIYSIKNARFIVFFIFSNVNLTVLDMT